MSSLAGDEKQQDDTSPSTEHTWAARPVLSRFLRLAMFLFPLGCAFVATTLARALLPNASETTLVWWIGLLALGVVVALGAERVTRRFLPLATLLKLSMLFPARAPSRFKVARTAGSVRQLVDLSAQDVDSDAGKAAEAILALVVALGAHDGRTRGHAERVRVFTDMLADELELPQDDRYRLRWAALLHDIGKLSIDASILNKVEPLTVEEWNAITRHPAEGVRMIESLAGWLGPWADAIGHHHERFDGTGYPDGIAGTEINLGGRIVAVADAYDTMTSARTYRRPKATRAAREELVWCAGIQFDPDVVRAFLAISLPRLLWATGPASLLVHLPFIARLQSIGQIGVASAAQALTASAAAGVVTVGLLAPTALPAERPRADVVRAVDGGESEHRTSVRPEKNADEKERERDRDDDDDRHHGGGAETPPPDDVPVEPVESNEEDGGNVAPSPEPTPEPSPTLEVTRGVTVPDVVGMREAEASTALEDAGFVVRILRQWNDDKDLKNMVGEQSEPAGSVVPKGTTITIVVLKWRNNA